MDIDYDGVRVSLQLIQLLGLCLLGIYTHITNKSKANAEAINAMRKDFESDLEKLAERQSRVERHQDVLESRVSAAPSHQDLAKMYDRLNTVASDMERLSGQMMGVAHQLSMVNEYLLHNKGDSR
ncbi:MAG: DUF2730 domain-containing protein [Marinobacter sp.]|nr:DUF2730 domain-containing protein [Marinobacter sp.]